LTIELWFKNKSGGLTLKIQILNSRRARVTSYRTRGRPLPQSSIGVATRSSVSGPRDTTTTRRGCWTSACMHRHNNFCFSTSVIFLPSVRNRKIFISVLPFSSVATRPCATCLTWRGTISTLLQKEVTNRLGSFKSQQEGFTKGCTTEGDHMHWLEPALDSGPNQMNLLGSIGKDYTPTWRFTSLRVRRQSYTRPLRLLQVTWRRLWTGLMELSMVTMVPSPPRLVCDPPRLLSFSVSVGGMTSANKSFATVCARGAQLRSAISGLASLRSEYEKELPSKSLSWSPTCSPLFFNGSLFLS